MNGASGAAAGASAAAAAGAIARAIKASGSIVQVDGDAFLRILARSEAPLVVHATGGFLRTHYKYLTSYKGLAFFTKESLPLQLPRNAEVVAARRIWIPD